MHTKLVFTTVLCFIVTPALGQKRGNPEAVAMFERLIKRIPPATDLHDVHKYIGKEFDYVFCAGNAQESGVEWAPFWIADRLYCIHRTHSNGVIAVYEIIDPDLELPPFSKEGQTAYALFKRMAKKRGSARVLDLHAVIDHNAKLEPSQLKYKLIHKSKPKASGPPKAD